MRACKDVRRIRLTTSFKAFEPESQALPVWPKTGILWHVYSCALKAFQSFEKRTIVHSEEAAGHMNSVIRIY
jgi:hypothetical protein